MRAGPLYEPVFTVGQRVIATGRPYPGLTEGREYVVTKYEKSGRDPTFRWPAYVFVLGDLGKTVCAHTHRFRTAA